MKRILFAFVAFAVVSCNSDEITAVKKPAVENSLSILDGDLLSYKNNEAFIKEYTALSELKTEKELEDWISNKKINSLFNSANNTLGLQDDVVSNSRIIYSDALKAILNKESKVKINNKVLWLNNRTFYVLYGVQISGNSEYLNGIKSELEVYGELLNLTSKKNITSRGVIPNENGIKTFVTGEEMFSPALGRIRHVLDLYNETIVLNDQIQSSKMFLRTTLQYRSCSTWSCTWKTELTNQRNFGITGVSSICDPNVWQILPIYESQITGSKSYLLATWKLAYPLSEKGQYQKFDISAKVQFQMTDGWHEVQISWY